MLTKERHHVEFFVLISRNKTTHIALFIFSDSCFSAAEIAKIALLALTVASLDNHLVFHARYNSQAFAFIVVWCIARQADRKDETVKHFHNCIKVLSQFRAPYCTNLRQYSKRQKRGGAHQGHNEGGEGGAFPRAPINYGGAKSLRGAELLREQPKSPNSHTSTSFNTVNLLSKEFRFDHGGAKLVFCPGRHLTSLRPWCPWQFSLPNSAPENCVVL